MILPQASLWSRLRRRIRPISSPSRRRERLFLARLELLERITLLSNFVVTSAADSGAGSLRIALDRIQFGNRPDEHDQLQHRGLGRPENLARMSALPTDHQPGRDRRHHHRRLHHLPSHRARWHKCQHRSNGLVIAASASGTIIKGLDLHSFGGDGIDVLANNVVLSANFIGTGPFGGFAAPNRGSGVVVRGSNNTIGGFNVFNPDGTFQVLGGNLISGNGGNGVVLAGSGNLVEGNWIGVSATGNSALGNSLDGVVIDGASVEHDRRHVGRHAERDLRQPRSRRLDREHHRPARRRRTPPRPARSRSPQAGINAGFSLSNFAIDFP